MPLDEFWRRTPREFSLIVRAKENAYQRDHNRLAWAVWHIDALRRQKRLLPLKKLLVATSTRRQTKMQSPDEIWSAVSLWHVAMGGKDKRSHKGKELIWQAQQS